MKGGEHRESEYGRIITLCRLLSIIIINVIFRRPSLLELAALQQSASREKLQSLCRPCSAFVGISAFNGTSFVCGNSRYMTYLQEEYEEKEEKKEVEYVY